MLLWSAPCPEGTRILQKPTASSEGAQLWDIVRSPSLGSARRDRLSSSTSYGMRQSPFGELYGVEVLQVPTAALLRSLQWVSLYRSRSAEPAAHTQSAASVGAWLRRDAIASYVCSVSSCIISSQTVQFTSSQGKHRRLWRLAVATQPSIADCQSVLCNT